MILCTFLSRGLSQSVMINVFNVNPGRLFFFLVFPFDIWVI
jgi:hypothetical protein